VVKVEVGAQPVAAVVDVLKRALTESTDAATTDADARTDGERGI
jgi:hypothetical protein